MKFGAGFAVIARREKAVGSDQHAIRIEAGIQIRAARKLR